MTKGLLNDLSVDSKHAKTVLQLTNKENIFENEELNQEELKSRITKVLDEQLPMLKDTKSKKTKIGLEKTRSDIDTKPSNKYLEAYESMKK